MTEPMPNEYAVNVEARYPEQSSRLLALCGALFFFPKQLLALPHLLVLGFVGIAAFVAMWIGYVIVLFTGKMPRGLFDFLLGFTNWQTRVNAWLFGLVDEYPPFRFK